ncbi:hypothetical protein FOA52_004295 [Chlamydomonas sp. UWO 241]|nr:hypothetical protein FOA52_004295 [Chlamydomonas sp. UWO 241]
MVKRDSMMPEAAPMMITVYRKAEREANAQRERGMCRKIVDLCSGKLARGKPHTRVLAIVGAAHRAPLIEMLKAV